MQLNALFMVERFSSKINHLLEYKDFILSLFVFNIHLQKHAIKFLQNLSIPITNNDFVFDCFGFIIDVVIAFIYGL